MNSSIDITNSLRGISNSDASLTVRNMLILAMNEIGEHRFSSVNPRFKESCYGREQVTDLDMSIQNHYISTLRRLFPTHGIIAEEGKVGPTTITSPLMFSLYWSIDPIDGTRAFANTQSSGIATQICLFNNRDFILAYVGDICTQEVFGFGIEDESVYQYISHSHRELIYNPKDFPSSRLLLRKLPCLHESPQIQKLSSLFENVVVKGGGIGSWIISLWTGEACVAVIPASAEKPWDRNPIYAISFKLGFVFLKPHEDGVSWRIHDIDPVFSRRDIRHDIVIVHRDSLPFMGNIIKH